MEEVHNIEKRRSSFDKEDEYKKGEIRMTKKMSRKDAFSEIDSLQLNTSIEDWLDNIINDPQKITIDRSRLAMEVYQETEDQDIEIRRQGWRRKFLPKVP